MEMVNHRGLVNPTIQRTNFRWIEVSMKSEFLVQTQSLLQPNIPGVAHQMLTESPQTEQNNDAHHCSEKLEMPRGTVPVSVEMPCSQKATPP